jgi:spermidine synthase
LNSVLTRGRSVTLLFFLSGVTGLIYEVFWFKELSLLLGSSSQAMATTLAAFFLGLAVGSYHWGARAAGCNNPLRLYGLLELAVALSVGGYFFLMKGYAAIYPDLFNAFGNQPKVFLATKFLLAMVVLFPPAYFIGGTLPVLGQYVDGVGAQRGVKVTSLYFVNTLGAVVGALSAGFYLPVVLGYEQSYFFTMALTVLVGLSALGLSRGVRQTYLSAPQEHSDIVTTQGYIGSTGLKQLSFFSGFTVLSLEVLWGRMFEQVLQNSVYTFAIILGLFLLFIALGSYLAYRLMQSSLVNETCFFWQLIGGAVLIGLSPFVFLRLTENLNYLGSNSGWAEYVLTIIGIATIVMGPVLLCLGGLLPQLIKFSEVTGGMTGRVVGSLVAFNTAGGIVGSLVTGFFVFDYLGLWAGIRCLAVLFCLAAWFWLPRCRFASARLRVLPALGLFLLVSFLDTGQLPAVKIDAVNDGESLLALTEGSAATVAVIRRGDDVKIKINNHYTLGGSGSSVLEAFQGELPLLVHPEPKAVNVLGLGTGITAGATLYHPIQSLTVTEVIPEVIQAADDYFGDYSNGLFYDPRARVIAEDGRNYLRGTAAVFDVIISDLFVPWKAGIGGLYSVEHYQSVRSHLQAEGIFMQWLPAYQLSTDSFETITRTLLAVFPQVTVWRGDFSSRTPVIGLIGHLTPGVFNRNIAGLTRRRPTASGLPLLTHYVGSFLADEKPLGNGAINSDDRPLIEFQMPINQRQIKAGHQQWLAGDALMAFMSGLQQRMVAGEDTFLAALSKADKALAIAGLYFHKAQWLQTQGRISAAELQLAKFQESSGVEALLSGVMTE